MTKSLGKWFKVVVPWLVAALIFYYLLSKYPVSNLIRATGHLDLAPFIIYSVIYFFFIWFMDCWSLSRLFTSFGFPTRIKELGPVRFASYLVMVVNYGVAQGVFAYFFKKAKNVPFFKSTSLVLFMTMIDLYWVITLAFVGSFFVDLRIEGVNVSRVIQTMWGGATVAVLAMMIFWRLPINWKAIHWVKSRDLLHTFHNAKPSDYGFSMLMRLPMHLAINTSLFFVAIFFGAHIPFFETLAFMPIVILIGTIPITPGGLGACQIATVELFQNHITGGPLASGLVSPGELLISMSLIGVFVNYFLKAVAGSLFFKKAVQYYKRG